MRVGGGVGSGPQLPSRGRKQSPAERGCGAGGGHLRGVVASKRDGSGNQVGSASPKDAPEVGSRFPASRVQLRTRVEHGSRARVAEREGHGELRSRKER